MVTKATEAENVGVSMDPDEFSQGGGLFDDVDAVVTKAMFTPDPPNENYTTDGNPLFFVLGIQIDGGDEPVEQSYSLGQKAGDLFNISEDGGSLIPINPASRPAGGSKFAGFMGALKTAEFPMNTLGGPGGTMRKLEGTRAHFNRLPDPERKGLKTGGKEKQYPQTTLVITKVHALPGAAVAAPAKGGKKAAGTAASKPAAAAKSSGDDYTQVAEETLVSILAANNGSIAKSKLPLAVVKELATNPKKQEIGRLIFSEEFLAREGAPWTFDKSATPQTVSLG